MGRARRGGEHDLEAGPAAGRALDENAAVMRLDDPVAERQTEAGAGRGLGGEERVEDALADLGRRCPGPRRPRGASRPRRLTAETPTSRRPPSGMASMALSMRCATRSWTCVGWPWTSGTSPSRSVTTPMPRSASRGRCASTAARTGRASAKARPASFRSRSVSRFRSSTMRTTCGGPPPGPCRAARRGRPGDVAARQLDETEHATSAGC